MIFSPGLRVMMSTLRLLLGKRDWNGCADAAYAA
jgi:hypothetical protein